MKIPMVDLKVQVAGLRDELRAAIDGVIDSAQFINGPSVAQLEVAVADYLGAGHAVGMSSGTDALLAALMALEVGHGDRVIVPTYSFFATAGAVARLGATPELIDIDPTTYNIDPSALRRWFEEHRDRADQVKAIIPVHLFGQCADMDPIMELADERGIAVIEDAAQAIGASHPSRGRAGTIGTMGALSFFPSKNLGCFGDGGMVITRDAELADRLRILRAHGAEPKYHHAVIGGNFRLDTIQAAVLLVKLPHLPGWTEARRRAAARYDQLLDGLVHTPTCAWGREHHVYNQYVIEVEGDRDGLRNALAADGIATSVFYPVPFHMQRCFAHLGIRRGALPHSERAAERSLALPMFPEMTERQQQRIAEAIRRAR